MVFTRASTGVYLSKVHVFARASTGMYLSKEVRVLAITASLSSTSQLSLVHLWMNCHQFIGHNGPLLGTRPAGVRGVL